MSEAEVIPDIRLESAGRNVTRIRQTVRLDLIGLAHDEFRRFFEIRNCRIETAQSDKTMPAVSIEPCVRGKLHDAFCINSNRFLVTSEVCGTPAEPKDSFSRVWLFFEELLRLVEFCFKVTLRFRRKLRRNFL